MFSPIGVLELPCVGRGNTKGELKECPLRERKAEHGSVFQELAETLSDGSMPRFVISYLVRS